MNYKIESNLSVIPNEEIEQRKEREIMRGENKEMLNYVSGTEKEMLKDVAELIERDEDSMEQMAGQSDFDKQIFLDNITYLLKEKTDVKIGQIEREADVSLGYLSRLRRAENTAEPNMQFVLTAARMLGVSVDMLLSLDLAKGSEAERYVARFLEKLIDDTLSSQLSWNIERGSRLNQIEQKWQERRESAKLSDADHPLLEECTAYTVDKRTLEVNGTRTELQFPSKNFQAGYRHFAGDCFNLKLKNGAILYLIDFGDAYFKPGVYNEPGDEDFVELESVEVWLHIPGKGNQALATSMDQGILASLARGLYDTVKRCVDLPKLDRDTRAVIDAFMRDDFGCEL